MFSKKLLAGVSVWVCVMLPAVAFSGVKIILKNGRSVRAESCDEKGGELTCSRGGGFFSVERGDVAKIERISDYQSAAGETVLEKPSDQRVPDKTRSQQEGEVQKVGDARTNLEKKLEEITRTKKELQGERARLLKDRQQLSADIKKAPDWMTEIQYNELSRRAADLEKRIRLFNKEISGLDMKEKEVIDQLEGRSGQTEKQPRKN